MGRGVRVPYCELATVQNLQYSSQLFSPALTLPKPSVLTSDEKSHPTYCHPHSASHLAEQPQSHA
jgi:hypothetical protein